MGALLCALFIIKRSPGFAWGDVYYRAIPGFRPSILRAAPHAFEFDAVKFVPLLQA
jgi:hypothetical protein